MGLVNMGNVVPEEEIFPLSRDQLAVIEQICFLIRHQIFMMSPDFLRRATIALLVLERLPKASDGIQFTVGWMTPRNDGNYEWVDLLISYEEIHASIGRHLYSPDIGGETQSENIFSITRTGNEFGSLSEWLCRVRAISEIGKLTLSFDWGDDIINFEEYD